MIVVYQRPEHLVLCGIEINKVFCHKHSTKKTVGTVSYIINVSLSCGGGCCTKTLLPIVISACYVLMSRTQYMEKGKYNAC